MPQYNVKMHFPGSKVSISGHSDFLIEANIWPRAISMGCVTFDGAGLDVKSAEDIRAFMNPSFMSIAMIDWASLTIMPMFGLRASS